MNLDNIITSQDYINDKIVAEKIEAEDFEILVSPEFEFEGATYRILLDGHHSLAAAIEAGKEPVVVEADSTDHDAVGLLKDGAVEDFMDAAWMGSDYRFAVSGEFVW